MVITKIIGGLGNQMFQYAFGFSRAKQAGATLALDALDFSTYRTHDFFLDAYQLSGTFLKPEEKKLLLKAWRNREKRQQWKNTLSRNPYRNTTLYREPGFAYDPVVPQHNDIYFEGYWQSERYFSNYRGELLTQFQPSAGLSGEARAMADKIRSGTSASLHVRRGDYVSNPEANLVHGTCSLEYYRRAVDFLPGKAGPLTVFVFSDDLAWARANLNFFDNTEFVDLPVHTPDYEEMMLMSYCDHNVIANSTFSWWSAWLNKNSEKIVIAPKDWFKDKTKNTKDLIPDTWVRL